MPTLDVELTLSSSVNPYSTAYSVVTALLADWIPVPALESKSIDVTFCPKPTMLDPLLRVKAGLAEEMRVTDPSRS
jgi:hypothetical protein